MKNLKYNKMNVLSIFAMVIIVGIFIIQRSNKKESIKSVEPSTDEISLIQDLDLNVRTGTDSLGNSESIGIFNISYSSEVSISRLNNQECNSYIKRYSECLIIEDSNSESYMLIKKEELDGSLSDFGGGLIIQNYFNRGQFFLLDGIKLLRSTEYLSEEIDFYKTDIAFVENIKPKSDDSYGGFSFWYVRDTMGYTISYYVSNTLANKESLEVYENFDKILSTIEINE